MRKSWLLSSVCAFTLLGLSSAWAVLPSPTYVDAKSGDNLNVATNCQVTTPCADLNTALSVTPADGQVIIVNGVFGPIVLTTGLTITGPAPSTNAYIVADPLAQVGCVGQLPANCSLPNNGFAVEVDVGADESVSISNVVMSAGISGGAGALKLTTAAYLNLVHDVFRGRGDTATGPIIALYPNNPGVTLSQVFISYSDIGFNGSGTSAGAIEVKPGGSTSLALHFNHDQIRSASYGIRTDGSQVTAGTLVSTTISDCELFGLTFAAMNAFSSAGTGTVQATFDSTKILKSAVGLKANGPLSSVVITNNTVTGNGIGVQQVGGATILTSGNNTIRNNGTQISGTLIPAALN